MLLAVDIGNSNVVVGGFENDRLCFESRFATLREASSAHYEAQLRRALSDSGRSCAQIEDSIVTSVVPPVSASLCAALVGITGREPMMMGLGLKTGLDIRTDQPEKTGSDRIVAVVAALDRYAPPLALMDLGTATTIEVVNRERVYLGGCIMPGVRTALDALTARAAQLPALELRAPGPVIGRNTEDSMRSGSLYGAAAMLDGMLARIEEELGDPVTAVATGGLAGLVIPLCRRRIILEEPLVLRGLNLIYRMNRP